MHLLEDLIRFVMTALKIIYNALVIKHCLNKVEDVNCDIEPPFPFFKFGFLVYVYVYVRVYFLYSYLYCSTYLHTIQVYSVYYLFYFDIAFNHDISGYRASLLKANMQQIYRITPMPNFDIEITPA